MGCEYGSPCLSPIADGTDRTFLFVADVAVWIRIHQLHQLTAH